MLKFSIAASRSASNAEWADFVMPNGFSGTSTARKSFPCTIKKPIICQFLSHYKKCNVKILPTILNGADSFSFFCWATDCACNFANIGLGSTRKSRKYDIDVPAMFGNFCANLPKP